MSEINVIAANTFKSTAKSRLALMDILNDRERKLFSAFVKSVGVKK